MNSVRAQKVLATVGNQIVSSLMNFLFAIYLLRSLSPMDFGLYNIGFAAIVSIGSLSQGFFLLQMLVLLPERPDGDRPLFAGRVFSLLVLAALVLLTLSFPLAGWVHATWELGLYAFLVVVATCGYCLKEFFVRYAFSREGAEMQPMIIHCTLAAVLVVGIVLADWRMSLEGAMGLYAVAHFAAMALGLKMTSFSISPPSWSELQRTFWEIADGGCWAALSSAIYSLRSNAHTIIVAALLGPVEVARLSAARILVTPAILLIPAASNLAIPKLAQLAAISGPPGVVRQAQRLTVVLFGVATAYSLLLISAWAPVSKHLLGEAYSGAFWLVVLWCLYSGLLALRSGAEWSAQVLKLFRQITRINLIGAVCALGAVAILTHILGSSGAIMGIMFGEAVVVLALVLMLRAKAQE